MKNTEMNIATEKLKDQRQGKGWTQQHLSDISGLSLRTIQRAETVGNVSNETLKALSAVFEVERSFWQVDSFSKKEKQQILQKGWRIALQSIALAQVIASLVVWLFVGSISIIWLKVLMATWLVLGFCFFVVRSTAYQHNLNSYQAFQAIRDKFKLY
ncbi:helix-turn-helix domain-containing protein [Marinicella gelatinilytica]|uniref:helix-turn-helix domain-containing protein n=1 Tax=Marinicella gelatinilytica TaxID=2996017 RepID=UPI002260D01B|nr:helix-turn-helix transcriptional regulator [Marinicella gelatinilytica]MCX7544716.1 helix-turn-helix transcriptional regulator [Marinicella gelatinilytica]